LLTVCMEALHYRLVKSSLLIQRQSRGRALLLRVTLLHIVKAVTERNLPNAGYGDSFLGCNPTRSLLLIQASWRSLHLILLVVRSTSGIHIRLLVWVLLIG